MSETTLFIGGPADGQRYTVAQPGEPFVYMEAPQQETVAEWSSPFTPAPIRHRYESRAIGGSSKKFRVYVHDGMTGDDVIAALLRGYHPDAAEPATRPDGR